MTATEIEKDLEVKQELKDLKNKLVKIKEKKDTVEQASLESWLN